MLTSEHYPYQYVFYGAPGTGKSHDMDELIKSFRTPDKQIFRTTFHPESDYSSFVGCYKPTKDGNGNVTYEYIPQYFLNAYIKAWEVFLSSHDTVNNVNTNNNVYLVIEELNRGNCAQIFGDIFQLLDRNPAGFSGYSIDSDSDMGSFLETKFKPLKDSMPEGAYKEYLEGKKLCLPPNFYIWATMNTSDQSLFPMDSAFRRRWDWKYCPIKNEKNKKYDIEIGDHSYDWGNFIKVINDKIGNHTHSEDKKIGFWFAEPRNGDTISKEIFLNKVLFHLWNEVYKDHIFSSDTIFMTLKDTPGAKPEKISFNDFFDEENNITLLKGFMLYNEIEANLNGNTGVITEEPEIETDQFKYWTEFRKILVDTPDVFHMTDLSVRSVPSAETFTTKFNNTGKYPNIFVSAHNHEAGTKDVRIFIGRDSTRKFENLTEEEITSTFEVNGIKPKVEKSEYLSIIYNDPQAYTINDINEHVKLFCEIYNKLSEQLTEISRKTESSNSNQTFTKFWVQFEDRRIEEDMMLEDYDKKLGSIDVLAEALRHIGLERVFGSQRNQRSKFLKKGEKFTKNKEIVKSDYNLKKNYTNKQKCNILKELFQEFSINATCGFE